MRPVRRAAVAGSWYPAQPEALAREVDRYLAIAGEPPAGPCAAIVAPHAGLKYSGPVAAYAYNVLREREIDVAVLVGPSHYVAFHGTAIYDRGSFDTPWGPVAVAEDCAAAIIASSKQVKTHATAHVREHSLEMQLPFLKRVLPETAIVPLVMGQQQRDTIDDLAEAIAAGVAGRRAVIVASTDLSHYEDASTAARLDRQVVERVERFDADGLMALLETNPAHACGGGPTVAVMRAAKALGARDGRALKYADSGDISGDKSAVVGYLAAAFGVFAAEP